MAISKVAFDSTTLIDLTGDTVASTNDIASGKVGHLNDGSVVTGTAQTGGGTDGQFFPMNPTALIMPTITMTYNGNEV